MQKKIYRSRTQKVLAGVCGGIAEYFNIDVTLVRLVWVILTLPGFFPGIILYIIAAIIIPEGSNVNYDAEKEQPQEQQQEFSSSNREYHDSANSQYSDNRNKVLLVIGLILIAIGGLSLIKDFAPVGWNILKGVIFPATIIVIGGAIVYSAVKNK